MAAPSAFEISNEQYLVATHYIASTVADVQFWTAPVDCEVVGIREVHAVAGDHASAVTATVRRCRATEAASAGDDLLGTTKINLKGTALTEQTPDLTSTSTDLQLEAGDRLSLDVTGDTQNLAGVIVTVLLKRI
jgi:hypothetical protein